MADSLLVPSISLCVLTVLLVRLMSLSPPHLCSSPVIFTWASLGVLVSLTIACSVGCFFGFADVFAIKELSIEGKPAEGENITARVSGYDGRVLFKWYRICFVCLFCPATVISSTYILR